jgi:hypothetical protein
MVGLAPKSGFKTTSANFNSCGYYLYVYNGTLYGQNGYSNKRYTSSIPKGSTIEVVYNKQSQQISFKIANKDCGVAFNNVTGDLYPAVELHDQKASVELL